MDGDIVFLALLSLVSCVGTSADLSCAIDDDCSRWGDWAPYCHGGTCSQCDTDDDCIRAGDMRCWTCETASDGFGTCVPDQRYDDFGCLP